MAFKLRSFNTPDYTEDSQEPKGIIVISCEGRVTEYQYFTAIKNILRGSINHLIQVELVPKNDNQTAPPQILDKLKAHLQKLNKDIDLDSELW